MVAQPLTEMKRIVVGSPRLRKPKTPADLLGSPALLQVTPSGAPVRWVLVRERDAEPTIVDVAGRLRVSAPAAIRDLAVAGAGYAYLPSWLVEEDLAAGRLRHVVPAWASPTITAYALFRTELRGSPRLRVLLAALA